MKNKYKNCLECNTGGLYLFAFDKFKMLYLLLGSSVIEWRIREGFVITNSDVCGKKEQGPF